MKYYNAEYYDIKTGCYSDPVNDEPIEAESESEAKEIFFDWLADQIRTLHSGEDPDEIENMINSEINSEWKIYEIQR